MNIDLYGTLRQVAGVKRVVVELPPGANLMDYLMELIQIYPNLQAGLMDEHGGLRTDLPLFINGRNPRLLPVAMHAVPQPDDNLSLFSPVSSGRINVEVLRGSGSKE
jgi:hypothetical protein